MSGFSRLPAAGKRVFIRTLHPGAALSYHAPMMKSLSIAALAAAILTCAWAPGAGARPVPVNGVLLDSYAAIVNQKADSYKHLTLPPNKEVKISMGALP